LAVATANETMERRRTRLRARCANWHRRAALDADLAGSLEQVLLRPVVVGVAGPATGISKLCMREVTSWFRLDSSTARQGMTAALARQSLCSGARWVICITSYSVRLAVVVFVAGRGRPGRPAFTLTEIPQVRSATAFPTGFPHTKWHSPAHVGTPAGGMNLSWRGVGSPGWPHWRVPSAARPRPGGTGVLANAGPSACHPPGDTESIISY
jgi:hypothetical protein